MDLFSLTQNIKSRLVQPRVYAITLERTGVGMSVSSVVAFDLEEAIVKAKEILVSQMKMPVEEAQQWKLGLFVRKSLAEITSEFTNLSFKEEKAVPETGSSKKNKLMKAIIDSKDEVLFKKTKKQFTEAEVKYLSERL